MAFALEHFPTFPYPPSGMQEVEEIERYLTSLHRSMQEFFSLLPRDIKDGISVVDLDDLANTTLADPDADRIVFWDDGAGVYTWLTANTGLAISGTNLNLSHLGIEALTDPGADRIFFWDDGETASKWLVANDFLTISGTNLNVDYVDEDDMVSNSATLLPTQQSVRAYVDNSIHSIIEQYLTDAADGDVATYLVMDNIETGQAESTAVLEDMGTGDNQLIEEWVTPLGGLGAHTLVTGVYNLHIHAERTDGGRTVQLYWELWTRTALGAETKRGTSEVTAAVTAKDSFDPHVVIGTDVDINITDRIVIKLYANVSAAPANDTDITIYMEGNVESHLRMPTPFSTISNIFVRHDLADAANDFLVASGADVFVKKTLAETGAILEGDIQHDNLQGITANEHLDWTNETNDLLTTGSGQFNGGLGVNVDPGTRMQYFLNEAGASYMRADTYSSGHASHSPRAIWYRARNTLASPQAVVTNDFIGSFETFSYDGSAFIASGAFRFLAEDAPTDVGDIVPTYFTLRLCNTSGVIGNRLYVTSGGNVGINKAPSSRLDIDLATADLEIVDAGTAGATEDGWISIEIGGAQHYIRTFASI